MSNERKPGGIGLLLALLIGAVIKLVVVLSAWLGGDMDLEAPVRLKHFLAVQVIELLVVMYLVYCVFWGGAVGVFG